MKTKAFDIIKDILFVAVICFAVNLIMRPKKQELPAMIFDDYDSRMEILENRMDINRELMGKTVLKLDSIENLIGKNKEKIVYVRNNKNAQDRYISTLSSLELLSKLTERYKDSIQ